MRLYLRLRFEFALRPSLSATSGTRSSLTTTSLNTWNQFVLQCWVGSTGHCVIFVGEHMYSRWETKSHRHLWRQKDPEWGHSKNFKHCWLWKWDNFAERVWSCACLSVFCLWGLSSKSAMEKRALDALEQRPIIANQNYRIILKDHFLGIAVTKFARHRWWYPWASTSWHHLLASKHDFSGHNLAWHDTDKAIINANSTSNS